MKKFNVNDIYEYIEKLYHENSDVRDIVNQYIKDKDITIRIANSIKVLPDNYFVELIRNIKNIMNNIDDKKEIDIRASAKYIEENTNFGKGLLNIFMKLMNEVLIHDEPIIQKNKGYIYYLIWKNVDMDIFKPIFLKYRSLSFYDKYINFDSNYIDIYIGITNDLSINFGFITYEKSVIKVGSFILNKSSYENIINNNYNVFSKHFIKTFNKISFDLFKKYIKVINTISNIDFYHTDKEEYEIIDDLIVFKFAGYGTWSNSSINKEDYDRFKKIIKSELSNLKFANLIKFSVNANNYWLTLKIKVI